MDNKKIMAVLAVLVIVLGGCTVYFAATKKTDDKGAPADDSSENLGGFYSWNPTVVEVSDGYSNCTPSFMYIAEEVFKAVYGDIPDYSGITLSDIPEKYLYKYNSFYTSNGDGTCTVKTFDNTSKGTSEAYADKVVNFTPTKILCYTDAYVDTIYMILCDYYGETAHSGASPKAEAKLWDIIPALSSSIKSSLASKYGLTVPESVETLGTTKEDLINYCDTKFTSEDKVIIFMSEYNIRSTNNSTWWPTNTSIEAAHSNIQFIYLLSNSPAMVLSTMEMVGKVIGFDNTSAMMTSVLAEIYVMQKAINESGHTATFYAETAAVKSVGSNTLMGGIMVDILGLINVYDGSLMGSKLTDDKIVFYKPEVLIFYKSDSRSIEQQMRISA